MTVKPTPFTLRVPDADIADLRDRLARARFPDQAPGDPWAYGTNVDYLRKLTEYWRNGFDWRAEEAALNAFPQFRVPLDGIDLHYLHVPGVGPDPMPLLLLHGWPGSVFEFLDIIPRLTDPARFGGDPEDAFTVIAPSLPGYGLSFKPGQKRFTLQDIADCVHDLMIKVLGIQKFAAQGGDWGAGVASLIGQKYPSSVCGIHLNLLFAPRDRITGHSESETRYGEQLAHWLKEETGYQQIQGTKPQTLAFGLTDSPAGLAAWIAEKFRSWSDNDGLPESAISRDRMLANIAQLRKFTAYKKGLELGGIVNSIATPQSAEIRPCPLNGRIKKRKPKICKILIASSEPLQGKLAPRRTWPAMVPGGVIIWTLNVSSNLCVAVPDAATA